VTRYYNGTVADFAEMLNEFADRLEAGEPTGITIERNHSLSAEDLHLVASCIRVSVAGLRERATACG
jgi:hypothetical protein